MRIVLRAREARFERDGILMTPAVNADVGAGELLSLTLASYRSATVCARMLAGIIKATHGSVLIADFDPQLQPVQVKRRVAFVSPDETAPSARAFQRALRFRAALWDTELACAQRRAQQVIDAFGSDDDFARAFALANVREVPLVVLDRPPEEAAALVRALCPHSAVVQTRAATSVDLHVPLVCRTS